MFHRSGLRRGDRSPVPPGARRVPGASRTSRVPARLCPRSRPLPADLRADPRPHARAAAGARDKRSNAGEPDPWELPLASGFVSRTPGAVAATEPGGAAPLRVPRGNTPGSWQGGKNQAMRWMRSFPFPPPGPGSPHPAETAQTHGRAAGGERAKPEAAGRYLEREGARGAGRRSQPSGAGCRSPPKGRPRLRRARRSPEGRRWGSHFYFRLSSFMTAREHSYS